jgi:hypothetical protein
MRRGSAHWGMMRGVFIRLGTSRTYNRGARSQGSCRGNCRFFHGPSMVILVTREGGPTSKRLLAIHKRTLVRSLARVNAAVTSQ